MATLDRLTVPVDGGALEVFAGGATATVLCDASHPLAPRPAARAVEGGPLSELGRLVRVSPQHANGSTPWRDRQDATPAGLADDLEAVRRALGLGRWVMYGYSAGGLVALEYAVRHVAVMRKLLPLAWTLLRTSPRHRLWLVGSTPVPRCSACGRPATKRHGRDGGGRQRFSCRPCRRTFTAASASALSGYRWPPEVILTAVGWYLSHPLSATSVMVFLAERGIDVSQRTVLHWVQTVGPLLAAEVRTHRRRPGTKWFVDEVFFFRKQGEEKRYLYRAIDEAGQVLDVLFRDHRDTEAAEAFFRRTLERAATPPTTVISDHHQPYIKAVQQVLPEATHVRTGLHRAHGETTKPIERSHIATRDRLRSSRGIKTLETGQRFFDGFEAVQALRHGHVEWHDLVPGYQHAVATPQEQARAVVTALHTRGAQLTRMPRAA